MVCKKCGTMITDSSAELCPACCAPLGEENYSSEDILRSDHYVNNLESYTPKLGTKWADFLGYFALWLGAIAGIGCSIYLISLTLWFPAVCLIVLSIINILAALSIIKRKRNANNMVTLVYASGIVGDILIYISFSLLGIYMSSTTSRIVISVLMIIINRSYFGKRSNIFVN